MDGDEDDRLVLAHAHVIGDLCALFELQIAVIIPGEHDLLVRILLVQKQIQLLGDIQHHVLLQQTELPLLVLVIADRTGILASMSRIDEDGRHPGLQPA